MSPELLKLAPLLVGRVRRGVVGSSRYARTLRDTVRQVAHQSDRRPVLITGEPGLEKDNLAALIHFGSSARKQLMVRLDGALLKPDGSDLFGSGGVLELLGSGSLLIDQLEHVPEALMPRLLQLAKDGTWGESGQHRCEARLFFTTETVRPEFDPTAQRSAFHPYAYAVVISVSGCATGSGNRAARWAGAHHRMCLIR